MNKIILSLIFLAIVLTSTSCVCASDVIEVTDNVDIKDFNFNDNTNYGGVIVPVGDKPNVDNYQFEGNYSTPEEIDGLNINNTPDDLYTNVIIMDTTFVDHENIYFMNSPDSKIGDVHFIEKLSHESVILSDGNAATVQDTHDLLKSPTILPDTLCECKCGSFELIETSYDDLIVSIVVRLLDSKGNYAPNAKVKVTWGEHTKIITSEISTVVFVDQHEGEHLFFFESIGDLCAYKMFFVS